MNRPRPLPIPLPKGEHAPEDSIEEVLRRIGSHSAEERLTLGEILSSLDHRAYGFVLLLLAAPNFTPGPSMPGFSTILALPAIAITAQMMLGRRQPWLPPWLARLGMRRRAFTRMVAKALPAIARLDRFLQPRLVRLANLASGRWTGAAAFLQALLLALPLPLYPMAPAAALVLMALGMIARDGLMLALGHAAGLASLALGIALICAAQELLQML